MLFICFDVAVRSVLVHLGGPLFVLELREYCNNGPYVYADTLTTGTSILRGLRYNIWLVSLPTVCPLTNMTVNPVENKPDILLTLGRGQPWRSLAIEETKLLQKPAMGNSSGCTWGKRPSTAHS